MTFGSKLRVDHVFEAQRIQISTCPAAKDKETLFSEILLNLSILEFRCKISKRPFGFCGCCLAFPQKSCPTFHYLYACCVDVQLLYFYNYNCRFSIFYYLLVTKKLADYLGALRTNQEHVFSVGFF